MVKPIMRLKLDPSSGEQIQRCRRYKLVTAKERLADEARAWLQDFRFRVWIGVGEGKITAKSCFFPAHLNVGKVGVFTTIASDGVIGRRLERLIDGCFWSRVNHGQ